LVVKFIDIGYISILVFVSVQRTGFFYILYICNDKEQYECYAIIYIWKYDVLKKLSSVEIENIR